MTINKVIIRVAIIVVGVIMVGMTITITIRLIVIKLRMSGRSRSRGNTNTHWPQALEVDATSADNQTQESKGETTEQDRLGVVAATGALVVHACS